jgi:hypothetical protein
LRVSCASKGSDLTAYRHRAGAYAAWLGEHADDHPDSFADVVGAAGAAAGRGHRQ